MKHKHNLYGNSGSLSERQTAGILALIAVVCSGALCGGIAIQNGDTNWTDIHVVMFVGLIAGLSGLLWACMVACVYSFKAEGVFSPKKRR